MFLALQSTSALEVGLEPSAESWSVDLCPGQVLCRGS